MKRELPPKIRDAAHEVLDEVLDRYADGDRLRMGEVFVFFLGKNNNAVLDITIRPPDIWLQERRLYDPSARHHRVTARASGLVAR